MRHSKWIVVGLAGLGLVGCAGQSGYRTMSPDAVVAEINGADLEHVRNTWYRLGAQRPGVHPSVFKAMGRPAGYAQGPFSARIFRVELDGVPRGVEGGSDALVRIGDAAAWDWQFLAFIDSPGGWSYAGCVDLPNNTIGPPQPEIRSLGPGRAWMVVRSCRQTTESVHEEEITWYQVRNGRLAEVLRIPGQGNRSGISTPFEVAYRAVVLDTFLTPENIPAVTVNVDAVYSNTRREALPGVTELFRRTGMVRFEQDPRTGRFIVDAAASDWTQEELAALLTDSTDEFVRLNRVQLVEMAHSGDAGKKQWLARLAQDSRSDEVRTELTVMAGVEVEP